MVIWCDEEGIHNKNEVPLSVAYKQVLLWEEMQKIIGDYQGGKFFYVSSAEDTGLDFSPEEKR